LEIPRLAFAGGRGCAEDIEPAAMLLPNRKYLIFILHFMFSVLRGA
jgi:hypothetical protein